MRRFYTPPDQCRSPAFRLPEREAHHAATVLRVRGGDRVVVLNGVGEELLCEVEEASRSGVGLRVVQRTVHARLPGDVTLLQAVPRGQLMEWIVEKAVELGVHRIVPLLSARAVPRWGDADAPGKLARWQATAIEAIKQCGAPWLPDIEAPLTPQAFLAQAGSFALPLIASLQPDARHPRVYFDAYRAAHGRNPPSVGVWVGPEGDFTPAEIQLVRAAGACPISLGPLVLRSETAACYSLSVTRYELQANQS
jgi:16S rRNA (uracil1498-N3)-methyltransferase